MIPTLEVFGRLAGYVGKAGRHYAGLQAGLRFHGAGILRLAGLAGKHKRNRDQGRRRSA